MGICYIVWEAELRTLMNPKVPLVTLASTMVLENKIYLLNLRSGVGAGLEVYPGTLYFFYIIRLFFFRSKLASRT